MQDNDRVLVLLAAAAVVLVIVAFALVARQPQIDYQPEDTPEGVVSNYLLAINRKEYGRAYGYLSPSLPGRPSTAEAFVDQAAQGQWSLEGDGATVFKADLASKTGSRAVVTVRATRFTSGELLDSGQWTETFTMRLEPAGETWRLVGGERYWNNCWDDPKLEWCRKPELPAPAAKEAP